MQKEKSKNKNNNKNKKNILGISLGILLLISSISLLSLIKILNILKDSYFIIISFIFLIFVLLIAVILFYNPKKKQKKIFKKIYHIVRTISFTLAIIFVIVEIFGIYYLNKTMNFLDNISFIKEEITNYYIIVLKDSRYQDTSDLYETKVAYHTNTSEEILDSLKLDLDYSTTSSIDELVNILYQKEVSAILVGDIIKNKIDEDYVNFNDETRIIKTISITNKIENITKNVSMKNTPFNVLISGIDSYGNINDVSRNDVNIVATVNPNSNKILLTSIPRDYYVKLHNKEGLNDKLTHASYYGTDVVVKTIEDILDIDINYYIKVNFSTVIDLINELGGITIYADQSLNKNGCKFIKGYNDVNGKCALVFSRERKSYSDGDKHRGRNQQEVIKGIFNKISSGSIIYEYNNILNVLDGKFATDMNMDEVLDFIKYELEDLPNYDINTSQLDGYGSMGETYSYPGQNLWIMIPYPESIKKSHDLIVQLMNK